jgi:hypothetical protein
MQVGMQRQGSKDGTDEALKEEYMKTNSIGNVRLLSLLVTGSREQGHKRDGRAA